MGGKGAEEIENFLVQVKKTFNPELILLFGSRARDEHLKTSDYDILIVSESFQGVHFLETNIQTFRVWGLQELVNFLPIFI